MIELTCGNCGSVLRLGNEFAGKTGQCPDCHAPVAVPEAPPKVGPDLPTPAPAAARPSPRFNRSRLPLIVALAIIVVFVVAGVMLVQSWIANKKRKLEQWAETQGQNMRQDVEAVFGEAEGPETPEIPPATDAPSAQPPEPAPEPAESREPAPPPQPEAPPTTEQILQQRVGSIELQDVMLITALDYLRETFRLPLDANWRHLADVGVTRGMRVTVSAGDVTVADVLTQLLDSIGSVPISYEVRDGAVLISTIEDLATNTIVKIYSIAALLPVREFGTPEPEDGTTEPVVESVIGRITDGVTSDKWASGDWVIRYVRGHLVITASPQAHVEIADLLQDIRQSRNR